MFSFRSQVMIRKYFAMIILSVGIMFSCTPDEYTYEDRNGEKPSNLSYVDIPDLSEGDGFVSSRAFVALPSNVLPEYFIKGWKKDGQDMGDFSQFKIDTIDGQITLKGKNDLTPGSYSMAIKVRTYDNVATASEDGSYVLNKNILDSVVFDNGLSFIVQPRAIETLTYTPAFDGVRPGREYHSSAPVVVGTKPITFALVGDHPAEFTIDAATGVISLASGHTLEVKEYSLNVQATNEAGDKVFENALTVNVAAATETIVGQLQLPDSYKSSNYSVGDDNIPSMTATSVDPINPIQDSNKRWRMSWGLWHQKFNDVNQHIIEFRPMKTEQEDYLLFDQKVSFVDAEKAKAILSIGHKYGAFTGFTFQLVVSTDYADDPKTATWTAYDINLNDAQATYEEYNVDLSAFDDQVVTIGLKVKFQVVDGITATSLNKNVWLKQFDVYATK